MANEVEEVNKLAPQFYTQSTLDVRLKSSAYTRVHLSAVGITVNSAVTTNTWLI
jgi:hypothetical protein